MPRRAGIRAVATALPAAVRTNAYYRERYPDRVAAAEASTLARIWSPPEGGASLFDQAMAPFVTDPFRGAVERRVLAPGETGGALELRAARAALSATDLPPARLDLLISCAFFPDQFDVGNAASLARELGVGGTAWNLETACSSALVAVDTAAALVEAGRHESVLVTTAVHLLERHGRGRLALLVPRRRRRGVRDRAHRRRLRDPRHPRHPHR